MPKSSPDPLLTVGVAALLCGVSRAAIYAALARGRLPRRYAKGNLVLRQSDLVRWEEDKKPRGRRSGSHLETEHKVRISEGQKKRWKQRGTRAGPGEGEG